MGSIGSGRDRARQSHTVLCGNLGNCTQECSLWRDISKCKAIVTETRGAADEFTKAIKRFRSLVDSGKGAIFIAVCRGKASLPSSCCCSRRPCLHCALHIC